MFAPVEIDSDRTPIKVEERNWYYSKRGALIYVENIGEDGTLIGISHYSGNKVVIKDPAQIEAFTEAESPDTSVGTPYMSGIVPVSFGEEPERKPEDKIITSEYDWLYEKYPHVVRGSVYKMTSNMKQDDLDFVKIDGKFRAKKKKKKVSIKAATRCRIVCQEDGCNNERDIKVQDAFQVRKCDECKNKKKRKNLDKFLDKKKEKKK